MAEFAAEVVHELGLAVGVRGAIGVEYEDTVGFDQDPELE